MKAIASCDEVALQLNRLMLLDKVDVWLMRRDISHLDVLDVHWLSPATSGGLITCHTAPLGAAVCFWEKAMK